MDPKCHLEADSSQESSVWPSSLPHIGPGPLLIESYPLSAPWPEVKRICEPPHSTAADASGPNHRNSHLFPKPSPAMSSSIPSQNVTVLGALMTRTPLN